MLCRMMPRILLTVGVLVRDTSLHLSHDSRHVGGSEFGVSLKTVATL